LAREFSRPSPFTLILFFFFLPHNFFFAFRNGFVPSSGFFRFSPKGFPKSFLPPPTFSHFFGWPRRFLVRFMRTGSQLLNTQEKAFPFRARFAFYDQHCTIPLLSAPGGSTPALPSTFVFVRSLSPSENPHSLRQHPFYRVTSDQACWRYCVLFLSFFIPFFPLPFYLFVGSIRGFCLTGVFRDDRLNLAFTCATSFCLSCIPPSVIKPPFAHSASSFPACCSLIPLI